MEVTTSERGDGAERPDDSRRLRGERGESPRAALTESAMRTAWILWLAMLVSPMILLLIVVFILGEKALQMGDGNWTWFIVLSVVAALIIPGSFFVRRALFRKYYQGRPVSPQNYIAGMLVVWAPLEALGIASMVACLVVDSLIPTIIPGVVAFVLYLALWPNGHAMTRPVGHVEDASTYEEPR